MEPIKSQFSSFGKIAATLALFTISCAANTAFAQEDTVRSPFGNRPEEIDLSNTYSPPLVYVENVNASLVSGYLQGDFTILNQDDDIVSDLQYRVEIYGEPMGVELSKDPQVLYVQMPVSVAPAVTPGERVNMPFSMELPSLPAGKFLVNVQLMQTGGRKLGWGSTKITIEKGDTNFIYLYGQNIVLPEFEGKAVDPLTGPNVDPGATVGFTVQMEHASKNVRTVTPVLDFYPYDTSRPAFSTIKFDTVRLAANTLATVQLPVTVPQKPGVYIAVLSLREGSKVVSTLGEYRIVVRGESADLISARLASVATKAGETVFAKIEFVGSADAETRGVGQLRIDLTDNNGVAGSTFIPEVALQDGVGQGITRIMLTRDLGKNPALHVVISNASGKTLRDATVPVKLSAEQLAAAEEISALSLWTKWYMQSWYLVRILIVAAICALLFIAAVIVKRHQKFATNALNYSVITGMLLAVFFSQTSLGLAWGGLNGIEVAAPRTYRENEAYTPSNVNQYRAFWFPIYDFPIVELFVNRPIHNSNVQCEAAIELDLRINYSACSNQPVAGRILARVDRSGQKQTTFTGVNANWAKVYDEFYVFGQCPGNGPCIRSKTSNASIALGLPVGTTQTTLQVYVKHDPYFDGLNPPLTDSFDTSEYYFVRRFSQAFNIWLNCILIQNPDISVVKTTTTPVVQQGNQGSFNIVVTNNGPGSAANVTLQDGLPFGLTFVSSSDNRCTLVGNSSVNCNFGTMTAGQQIPVTFTYQTSAQTQCTTIPNIVAVATTSPETNLGNNQSSASFLVQCPTPTADITVVKTTITPTVQQGNQASFTILVTNNGPSSAANVTLQDSLPAGLTFVSSTDNRCVSNAGNISCNFGTMTAGQQIPVTFTYQTSTQTQCGTIPNVATVATTTQETNQNNNQSTASINVTCQVDIQVTKTAATPSIQQGSQGSFTITVRNNGPITAANVTLTDVVPAGLTFVSSSDNRCSLVGSSVNCNFGSMTSGQQIPITFTYSTSAQTQCSIIPNTAVVATTTTETNLANNTSTASMQVVCPNPQVDIQVTKTAATPTIQRGSQGSFTITVRNNGPDTAQNVVLNDVVPNGLTFVSSSDNRCSLVGSSVNCSFGSMTNGQQIPVTFTYSTSTQTQCSLIPNIATVSTTTPESNLSNNQSTASIDVQCPQQGCIDVIKEVFDPNGNLLTTIPAFTFQLDGGQTVQNSTTGNARFNNVPLGSHTVTEQPLSGWSQILVTPSGGVVNVTSSATCSTVTFKNQQTVTVPQTGCIEVRKTTLNTQGTVLTPVTQFTFQLDGSQTAVNDSSGVARFNNVSLGSHIITETLPSGWTRTALSPSNGVVTVTASPNNQSCAQVNITNQQTSFTSSADLSIVKTGPTSALRGSTLSYSLLVTNNGPSSATSVQVLDSFPSELTFVSSGSDSRCSLQGNNTISCQLGSMTSGQQISLNLQFQSQGSSTSNCSTTVVTDTATVSSTTSDSNSSNNTSQASTTLTCQTVAIASCPDIDISVDADKDPVEVGDEVTYRIRLENNDNDDVTVDVHAELDSDLEFEDADHGGDDDDDEVDWDDIDIDGDDEEELELVVSVDKSANDGDRLRLDVELTVNGRNCDDASEDIRVVEEDTPTPQARMTIDKAVDRAEAQPGDIVTYTLTIKNSGGSAVNSVNIDDVYTAGQLSIIDSANATVSGTRLQWNFDRFDANSTRTIRYTARISSAAKHGDVVANTVTLTAPGQSAQDSALVRVIQQLPQTGLGRFFRGDTTYLSPVATATASDGASHGSPLAPLMSVLLSGLALGGYVGKKILL